MADKRMMDGIKVLRELTGAGVMDCKQALTECDYNIDEAVDWLRKKGIAKASARSGKIAAEGLAYIKVCDKCGKAVIVEVNCETDFVSRSDDFQALVDKIAELLLEKGPQTIEEAGELVEPLFVDATVKMGEKLSLRRFTIVEKDADQVFGRYIHMGGKIGVLLVTNSTSEEDNKHIAMHIAAEAPVFISEDDIPQPVKDHEAMVQRALALQDENIMKKEESLREKIITNKIRAVLNEKVLYEQGYLITDGKEKVGKVLQGKGIKVINFVRYQVGEGIEKKVEDFADEVLSQIKN